jgi:hypothetical protein
MLYVAVQRGEGRSWGIYAGEWGMRRGPRLAGVCLSTTLEQLDLGVNGRK